MRLVKKPTRKALGRALLGKRAGEEVELKLAGKTRVLSVLEVS